MSQHRLSNPASSVRATLKLVMQSPLLSSFIEAVRQAMQAAKLHSRMLSLLLMLPFTTVQRTTQLPLKVCCWRLGVPTKFLLCCAPNLQGAGTAGNAAQLWLWPCRCTMVLHVLQSNVVHPVIMVPQIQSAAVTQVHVVLTCHLR